MGDSPPSRCGPNLDLRVVRYFVALAEELHFGHAATRVHVTQPALSRAIQSLEEQVGLRLVSRSSRSVALTDAGVELLRHGRALLARQEEALADLQRTAQAANEVLRIGFLPGAAGPLTDAILSELAERAPTLAISFQRLAWPRQIAAVQEGDVDVAFARLPADAAGLFLEPFYSEPVALMVNRNSSLAARREVQLAEAIAQPLCRLSAGSPSGDAFWTLAGSAVKAGVGVDAGPGPTVSCLEEAVEHVALGRAAAVVPLSVARMTRRSAVAALSITGAPASTIALAGVRGAEKPAIGCLRAAIASAVNSAARRAAA